MTTDEKNVENKNRWYSVVWHDEKDSEGSIAKAQIAAPGRKYIYELILYDNRVASFS